MRRVLLAETTGGARGCDALALTLLVMARTLEQKLSFADSLDRMDQSMVVNIEPLGSIYVVDLVEAMRRI